MKDIKKIMIKINNWEKYQPNFEKARNAHWFKVSTNIMHSESLHGLGPAEKWLWMYLLCQAGKQHCHTIVLDLSRTCHDTAMRRSRIVKAIAKLEENQALSIVSNAASMQHQCGLEENRLEENRLEQRQKREKTSSRVPTATHLEPHKKIVSGSPELIKTYIEAYYLRYKARPVIDGRTQGLVKRVLETIPLEQAKSMVQVFLQMNDKWFITKAHDFCTFYENMTKIGTSLQTGTQVGGMEIDKSLDELLKERDKREQGVKDGKNILRSRN